MWGKRSLQKNNKQEMSTYPLSAPRGAEHGGDWSQESGGRSSVESLEFILRAMIVEPLGFLLVFFVFNVVLEITWRLHSS